MHYRCETRRSSVLSRICRGYRHNHLTEFCSVLYAVDAVNIPQLMKTLFTDAYGIPKFVNAMEAAQRNSKCAKLEVKDEYMHAVALKYLLKSGEYETETREWSELPKIQKHGQHVKRSSGRHMWRSCQGRKIKTVR